MNCPACKSEPCNCLIRSEKPNFRTNAMFQQPLLALDGKEYPILRMDWYDDGTFACLLYMDGGEEELLTATDIKEDPAIHFRFEKGGER